MEVGVKGQNEEDFRFILGSVISFMSRGCGVQVEANI